MSGKSPLDVVIRDHERVYFDLSSERLSQEEKEHVEKIQGILGVDYTQAFIYGMAICSLVGYGDKYPYDGWFEDVQGDKRKLFIDYVKECIDRGIYS